MTGKKVNRNVPIFIYEDEACKVGAWMQGEEPMSLLEAFRAVFMIGLEHIHLNDPKVDPFYMEEGSAFRIGWRNASL